mmetsp:Transcript_79654/g.110679  ORF Transcript_79654/g.110679 Transcript_79654/m.110679 type:complete len:82 (+) Transcript_79654:671-916(+)
MLHRDMVPMEDMDNEICSLDVKVLANSQALSTHRMVGARKASLGQAEAIVTRGRSNSKEKVLHFRKLWGRDLQVHKCIRLE